MSASPDASQARGIDPAWILLVVAVAWQGGAMAGLVWSWGAGFGGVSAPWTEASSHSVSNAFLAMSALGTALNTVTAYVAVSRLSAVRATVVTLGLVPPCVLSTGTLYGLFVLLGWG